MQSSLLTNPSHLELFSVIMLIYCDVYKEFAVELIWANATKLFCYEPCRECWLDYTGHVFLLKKCRLIVDYVWQSHKLAVSYEGILLEVLNTIVGGNHLAEFFCLVWHVSCSDLWFIGCLAKAYAQEAMLYNASCVLAWFCRIMAWRAWRHGVILLVEACPIN